MTVEGPDDVAALRRVGRAVADARDTVAAAIAPGISTAELDAIAGEVLRKHGARSAPQLAYKFPAATCISVNDALAHGIPSARYKLKDGDLINVDVSAELEGYWADTGASFAVGSVAPRIKALLSAARRAQQDGMKEARAGQPLKNIGRAVERRAKMHGFQVIKSLCGHGVGRFIHEDPSVPNTYDARDRTVLWEGLVIAVEPFLTTGATTVIEDDDGWTLRTPDGSLGAQFEHTIIVTKGDAIVVT